MTRGVGDVACGLEYYVSCTRQIAVHDFGHLELTNLRGALNAQEFCISRLPRFVSKPANCFGRGRD